MKNKNNLMMQQNDEIDCFSYPINKFQTSVLPPVFVISNKIHTYIGTHTQILNERYINCSTTTTTITIPMTIITLRK